MKDKSFHKNASLPDCWTLDTYATETTTYPDGISDHVVHVDRRGVRTVSTSRSFADREESVALTFHPTNLAVHVLASTNITYRNGRSISIQNWDGGWTHETSWVDYTANGTRCSFSITEASDSPSAVTNQISQSDFLGRTVETLTPGAAGGWLVTSNAYDGATSRLTCSETTGQPATTYLYDVLGESAATIQSGIATASETRYEIIDGEVWQVAIRSSSLDGITNAVSISRRQMTGLSNSLRSRTVSIDPNGSTTTEESAFDPQTCELTTTRTTDSATPFITISKFGRTIRRESLRDAVDYYFDPLGRAECSDVFHPVTDEILYSRWSAFDESDNETEYGIYYYGDDLHVSGSKTFDAFNREATRTDALGNTVTTTYDALGRPVATSGATYPIRYGYDAIGRMSGLSTTRTGTAWDTTHWRYDFATGLVTNKVYADNSVVFYAYTPDGKPLRTTWARGAWREQISNPDGLLAATSYSDATPSVSLVYDAFQRLSAASNAVAAYVYANSAPGTATNETSIVCGEVCTLTRELDDRQRLASLSVGETPVHYAFDVENRLAVVSNDVLVVSYQYTPDGLDAGYAVRLTNGITLARRVVRDPFRRQLVALVSNTVDTVAISAYDYEYDYLGRVTNRNDDAFGYNARSEVTAANVASNDYGYAYDNTGNHLFNTVNAVTNIYEVNALNQYTNIIHFAGSIRPVHDLDGNMISNGVWTYTWDAANQLTAAYSNSVCVVSNAYDYMSRRVAKWTPSHTTTYVYNSWNLAMEIQSSNVQPFESTTNIFVWGKDLSGTLQGAGGVGGLLAVCMGGQYYLPMYDANGNITAYIDEFGSVVASYTYDAFGSTVEQSGSMANSFAFRFSTKYHDSEPSLYYYGMRFYSPDLHRWLNRDPIEENGGLNLYGFCGNNGVNQWDLLGMTPDFATFWFSYNKYSYKTMTSEEVWKTVGGAVADAVYRTVSPGVTPNACATRVSLALNEIPGEEIPDKNRDFVNQQGGKGASGNYIVRASTMGKYLAGAWGNLSKVSASSAYYFTFDKTDIIALRKEIEKRTCREDYTAVVFSAASGRLTGHVGVVTKFYNDPHTPFTSSTEVWILPPTTKPETAKQ